MIILISDCNHRGVKTKIIREKDFELTVAANQKTFLIVFPGYFGTIENTNSEAEFLSDLRKNGVSTLLLNLNRKLYLTVEEKHQYATFLTSILDNNKIDKSNIYFAGFSSGGNVSLLLADFLLQNNKYFSPKGVLVLDSPIDIEQLYKNAAKDVINNASSESYNEGSFLVNLLSNSIGNPEDSIKNYEKYSPYLISENYLQNMTKLKNIKLLFYAEPDIEWQMQNRKRSYEDLNAFMLESAAKALAKDKNTNIKYLARRSPSLISNGKRNPHSWNIISAKEIIQWIGQ